MSKLRFTVLLPLLNSACGVAIWAIGEYGKHSSRGGVLDGITKLYAGLNAPAAAVTLVVNEAQSRTEPAPLMASVEFLLISILVWYGIGRIIDRTRDPTPQPENRVTAISICALAAVFSVFLLFPGIVLAINAKTHHDPTETMAEAAAILVWALILFIAFAWELKRILRLSREQP